MRRAFVYAVPGDRHALIRGVGGFWCRDNRVPAYRTNIHNGWWVRSERVANVVAGMENSGIVVTYSTSSAPRHQPPSLQTEEAA